ncbi:tyrosine-protein kinase domain-containing protein [Brachybacterium huguangmaarense]
MTIEDFFRLLLRNAMLLIIALVLGAGLGYGYSYTKSPVYQATALGFVRDASGAGAAAGVDTSTTQYSKAQFYLPLFGTRAVGQSIVDELGLQADPDGIAGSLQAALNPNAAIITVTASADTPQHASDIANTAIGAVAAEADKLEPGTGSQLVAYQTALVPGAPVSPDRTRFAAIGAGIGLLLGLGFAWLRNRNDSRIRTVEDIRTSIAVPSLGVLPEAKDLGRDKNSVLRDPQQFQSREALRKLRTNLRYADVDNPPRSVVVTSSAPGEGKSTVAANLARVLARAGQRTLLIDADLRRPVEATQFGLDGSVGLSQLLAGGVQLSEVLQKDPKSRLMVLPAGEVPPNPSELLGSRRMHELVATLTPEFFVIIDAPPLLAVTDAQLLARHTDGAIIVAVPGRTRVEGMTRAVESIRAVGGTVFGAVMNRASSSRLTRLAYGDAEYGYSAYGSTSRTYSYGYTGAQVDGPEGDIDTDAPVEDGLVPAPVTRESEPPSQRAGAVDADDAPRHRGRRAAAHPVDEDSAP